MLPYRAVCFDFDYTLGDSTDSIVAGFQHAFPILGWPAPDRETVRGTIGYLLEDSYTMLTGDESAEHRARFRALFLEVAQERQRTETVLFPGAAELLRGLKEQGVPAAIVSTKRGDTIQAILAHHGLRDVVGPVLGSADVKRHKPDPEGLNRALGMLGLAPRDLLFCGDTILDAGAAQRAGTRFCAVLNGVTPAQDFAPYPCDHIAPDLWDLKGWLGV